MLGVPPSDPAVARPAATARLMSEENPASANLELPLTSFVGREQEINALVDLLHRPDIRLITLAGPGGVGKTRLALQVAPEIRDRFDDRVAFVSLASVRDPELVLGAIAHLLRVPASAAQSPMTRLQTFLVDRNMLLVLDNFEHVLAAAPLVTQLLTHCPLLKVVCTSRTRLGVMGERVFPVRPLPPDVARELFADRAQAQVPTFALEGETSSIVDAICTRLVGLPLAIELAAARVSVLPPRALLHRLEHQLEVLTGGPSDAPVRHRTMRDAISWSCDLLAEEHQVLFGRLAVFVGGFTLDAADRVAGAGASTLEGISALVSCSLVDVVETPNGEPRFSMLETIREYAREELEASGEEQAIQTRHALYYLAMAEMVEPQLRGPKQAAYFQHLKTEQANLYASLHWFKDTRAATHGLQLCEALALMWFRQGQLTDARAWTEAFLALPAGDVTPAVRTRCQTTAASFATWQADFERAEQLLAQALVDARALGDASALEMALRGQGFLALNQGDLARAKTALHDSLALANAHGKRWAAALSTYWLGMAALDENDFASAARQIESARVAFQRVGDNELANRALSHLGFAVLADGNPRRAADAYTEALARAQDMGDHPVFSFCLLGFAGIAASWGEVETATRLLGAASAGRTVLGMPLRRPVQKVHDEVVTSVRDALGKEAFAAAWSAGGAMSLEQAIDETQHVMRLSESRYRSLVRVNPAMSSTLTPRETEVLGLVVEGYSDREIADTLSISHRTVMRHVSSILGKLGVSSRTAAATSAIRLEILPTAANYPSG